MKMKSLLSLLLAAFFSVSLYAEKVEPSQAVKIAEAQYKKAFGKSSEKTNLVFTAQDVETQTVFYYIFNHGNDEGFSIISGDDVAPPVLGYSKTGNYDPQNLPPNFAFWMNEYQKKIAFAVENNAPQCEKAAAAWKAYLNEDFSKFNKNSSVEPLLTSQWGQRSPYNDLCPNFGGEERAVAGCVAIAMSQIMNYHKYPLQGEGVIPGYYIGATEIPDIDLSETEYQWDLMLDSYEDEAGTEEEREAVATLVYHCGVSVKMSYGLSFSGAYSHNVAVALLKYYHYDKGIQYLRGYIYSEEGWLDILKKELDESRPVYYDARDPDEGGHAFIVDGYDENDLIHIDWGWTGKYNGYFSVSDFEVGNYNFSHNHGAIIGIQPDQGNEPIKHPKIYLVEESELISSAYTIKHFEEFVVEAQFVNYGLEDFNGYYGIALTDENDQILRIIGMYEEKAELPANYHYLEHLPFDCFISDVIYPGLYFIRAVAQDDGEDWKIVRGTYGLDRLSINVDPVSIKELNGENLLIYPNPVSESFFIGTTDALENITGVHIYNQIGQLVKNIEQISGQEVDISDLPSGVYVIRLTTEEGAVSQKIIKR